MGKTKAKAIKEKLLQDLLDDIGSFESEAEALPKARISYKKDSISSQDVPTLWQNVGESKAEGVDTNESSLNRINQKNLNKDKVTSYDPQTEDNQVFISEEPPTIVMPNSEVHIMNESSISHREAETEIMSDQELINPYHEKEAEKTVRQGKTEIINPIEKETLLSIPPLREKKISSYKEEVSQIFNQNKNAQDSRLQLTHYLKLAQNKVEELEKEVDKLREENELLMIAAQASRRQTEQMGEKLNQMEEKKREALEQAQMEVNIYRDNLSSKEKERKQLEDKIRDLEGSVSMELKKIRFKERELENRLELSKHERMTLLKAKDEAILDLRRKIDDLHMELENYQSRYSELNKKVADQQGQLSRTVKALRLALAHLESQGEANNLTPLKKAE